MAKINNLLIEIGTEELPTHSLLSTQKSFFDLVVNQLIEAGFLDKNQNQVNPPLVSPRRFAIRIEKVSEFSASKTTIKRGPKKDTNSKIIEKFAQANGLEISDLVVEKTDKGEYFFAKISEQPKELAIEIAKIIENSLKAIATKKSMRWADFDFQFLRPIHTILVKFGKTNFQGEVYAIKIGSKTQPHRNQKNSLVEIDDEKNYESILEKNYVLVNFEKRVQQIINQVLSHCAGAQSQIKELTQYANQVANLVEWPVALIGKIGQKYLDNLPIEVLETILFKHQYCFIPYQKDAIKKPMQKANELLTNEFVSIANLQSVNPELVVLGYEKVITARLEDGLFFYKNDSEEGKFEQNSPNLAKLIFHHKLGSYKEKIARMQKIADFLLDELNSNQQDRENLNLSIRYAKNDLLSSSVIEMPELQGVFGAYLVKRILNNQNVVLAIKEQYLPTSRYDDLPQYKTGELLSLIDKLDSLVGLWLAGLEPKGSKDPFALRRSALAIVRILMEGNCQIKLNLNALIQNSFEIYANQNQNLTQNKAGEVLRIEQFITERLEVYFAENFSHLPIDLIRATINPNHQSLKLSLNKLNLNLKDLEDFYTNQKTVWQQNCAIFKRINNLAKNISLDKKNELDLNILNAKQEKDLINKINQFQLKTELKENLHQLNQLSEVIFEFLENIQINCDDANLKAQRQLLLIKTKSIFDSLELDFSAIQSVE